MYLKFVNRYVEKFEAEGYSADEVEEEIMDRRVTIETNREAGYEADYEMVRGAAPRRIMEKIEEIRTD